MEVWQRNTGKKHKKFTYTYQDIADLTKLKQSTIRRHAQAGKLNPDSLESVIKYIGKYTDQACV